MKNDPQRARLFQDKSGRIADVISPEKCLYQEPVTPGMMPARTACVFHTAGGVVTADKKASFTHMESAFQTCAPYLRLAIIAAVTEQAGAYGLAASAWRAAAEVARRESNKEWALKRHALCEKARERGWGVYEKKGKTS